MTVYLFFTILAVIMLIDAPFVAWLLFVKKQKSIDIIGTTLSLLSLAIGIAISVLFHLLHVEFSGDPANSPLWYGLAFTAIAATPFIAILYVRLRKSGRQGYCIKCEYDLRGSRERETCPECGTQIDSTFSRAACAMTSRPSYLGFPGTEASMSVYGMDLRRKVVAALEQGHSVASVARRFEIDEKTVRSYRRRAAERRLEPDRGGPRRPTKLTDADLATLRALVGADPGITLRELQGKLSVKVAESTVCRALQRLDLSFKKSR